jgi:hypothetical protein
MDRRKFLGAAAVSAAAVSATTVSAVGLAAAGPAAASAAQGSGVLHFRAESGLPGRPWPAYATAVAEGSVDLRSGTGFVVTRVLAGQPGSHANIGLPGTGRLARITNAATTVGGTLRLQGVVEDRSTLAKGESARQNFVLDRANKQFRTAIAGTEVLLTLLPGTS